MYDTTVLRRCLSDLCNALEQRLEDSPNHQALFLRYQEECNALEEALDEAGLIHLVALLELRDALDLEKQVFWLSRGMELGKYELELGKMQDAD